MIKCVFKSSPIFFILLIICNIIINSIDIVSLFIFRELIKYLELTDWLSYNLNKIFILIFCYLFFQLFIKNIFRLVTELVDNVYYKQSDRFFRTLLLYKLGNVEQEKMYDNDFFNKFEYTFTYLYMFQQLPSHLITVFIDFGLKRIAYIIIIFSFNFWIGVYSLIFFILNFIFIKILTKEKEKIDNELILIERKKNYFLSLLSEKRNIKETKINKLENKFLHAYKILYEKAEKRRLNNDRKLCLLNNLSNLVVFLSISGLELLLLWNIYNNLQTIADFTLITTAGVNLFNAGNMLLRPLKYMIQFASYSPTMINLLYPVSSEDYKKMNNFNYNEFSLNLGEYKKIQLKNVSYFYPKTQKYVLKEINLEIKKGEIIVIIGYNGSGKTTLSKLIAGVLKPKHGEVYFNNIKVDEYNLEEYQKYFGFAFQDYGKFDLSIRENIGFGQIENIYNDDLINEAKNKANLGQIIEKMPNKLETYLGKEYDSSGQDLSGGQWQRIILARAYMGNPDILILDEPTASIDPIEEERMLQHLKNILNGKTAILVSHRISFAQLASKIIFMENGEIKEIGTHKDLIQKKGLYYNLYMIQNELYS